MIYRLAMNADDDESSTESIAATLEQAAKQVRQMSSLSAAHSMTIPIPHGAGIDLVTHGTERGERAADPFAAAMQDADAGMQEAMRKVPGERQLACEIVNRNFRSVRATLVMAYEMARDTERA